MSNPYPPQGQDPQPQYGSQPAPYGSQPASYGSQPAPYGSQPAPYGVQPGQQAMQPAGAGQPGPMGQPFQGQPGPGHPMAPGQPAAVKPKKDTPGLVGPLTLRDLLLLLAGFFAFLGMVLPVYRFGPFGFGGWVWSWSPSSLVWAFMGMFIVLVAAIITLLNKVVSGFPQRIGSLSPDQLISVLTSVAFAVNMMFFLTSVQVFHVGGFFAFFGALIAFFAGVFTFLPFLGAEFQVREESPAHPKARPVKRAPRPVQAPGMHAPGMTAAGMPAPGMPGFAEQPQQAGAHGSAPQGYGSAPQAQGAPAYGSAPAFGSAPQGQTEAQAGYGSAAGQFSADQQPQAFGQQGYEQAGFEQQGFGSGQPAYGQPAAQQDQPAYGSAPQEFGMQDAEPAAQQQVSQDEQAYLGARTAQDPAHAQSEPTQAFMAGFSHVEGPADAQFDGSGATDAAEQDDAVQDAGEQDAPADALSAEAPGADALTADEPAADALSAQEPSPEQSAEAPFAQDVTDALSGSAPQVDQVTSAEQSDQSIAEESAPAAGDAPTDAQNAEDTAADAASDTAPEGAAHTDAAPEGDAGEGAAPDAALAAAEQPAVSLPESQEETVAMPASAFSGQSSGFKGDQPFESAQTAGDPNEPTQYFRVGYSAEEAEQSAAQEQPAAAQEAQAAPVQQAFWFAVPEPRDALDPQTGAPLFTVVPGEWFLALAEHGTSFTVRSADGREGVLHNIEGVQRG